MKKVTKEYEDNWWQKLILQVIRPVQKFRDWIEQLIQLFTLNLINLIVI